MYIDCIKDRMKCCENVLYEKVSKLFYILKKKKMKLIFIYAFWMKDKNKNIY